LEIALRTVIIYIIVLAGIRLSGKREVGQMTLFDLVLLLLLANAVQNAMTGPDTSLTGGLVAVGSLLIVNTLVARISSRSRKFRRVLEGVPTVLIHKGELVKRNMENERINIDELRQVLREHGIATIEEVSLAMLEVDGTISVLKKDELPQVARPHHHIRFLIRNKY
jgi:uncharacterized membrane protein YcaP (DUF421 family)